MDKDLDKWCNGCVGKDEDCRLTLGGEKCKDSYEEASAIPPQYRLTPSSATAPVVDRTEKFD